jgi:lysophospholipase L1-like esterase
MKNWLISFISIILSLVVFEVILRTMVQGSGLHRFGSEKVENYEFSYLAAHNSLGYRGEEFSQHSPTGTRRVLFIGDSFVYGAGVARGETIPSLLEDKLNSLGQSRFEILNLGLPDGNTVQYLETAKAFSDFDADIVLLGFYVDNDIWVYEKEPDFILLWSLIQRAASSFYYRMFQKCRYDWVNEYDIDKDYKRLACERKISPSLVRRANLNDHAEQSHYRYMAKQILNDPAIIENIKSIHNIFNDKIFYVTIFPSKYQISQEYFGELKKIGFKFLNNSPVNNKIQSNLRLILERNGISYIDLLPAIAESHSMMGRRHYYDLDDHFNGYGNEVVATAIADVLRSRLRE